MAYAGHGMAVPRQATRAAPQSHVDDDSREWLTKTEVAARLNVGERTVQRWISARKLPVMRTGTVLRVKASDLDSFARGDTGKLAESAAASGIRAIFGSRKKDHNFKLALNRELRDAADEKHPK